MIYRVGCHADGFVFVDTADPERALAVAAKVFDEGGVQWVRTLWDFDDKPHEVVEGMRYWTDTEIDGEGDDADIPE